MGAIWSLSPWSDFDRIVQNSHGQFLHGGCVCLCVCRLVFVGWEHKSSFFLNSYSQYKNFYLSYWWHCSSSPFIAVQDNFFCLKSFHKFYVTMQLYYTLKKTHNGYAYVLQMQRFILYFITNHKQNCHLSAAVCHNLLYFENQHIL